MLYLYYFNLNILPNEIRLLYTPDNFSTLGSHSRKKKEKEKIISNCGEEALPRVMSDGEPGSGPGKEESCL